MGIGVLKQPIMETLENRNSHNLLVTTVHVGGKQARGLIDSGATHNFVSSAWVEGAEVVVIQNGEEFRVTLADGGEKAALDRGAECLTRMMDDLEWKDSPQAIDLKNYDVILGRPWLSYFNPTIDFRTNLVTTKLGGKRHCFSMNDPVLRRLDVAYPPLEMNARHQRL